MIFEFEDRCEVMVDGKTTVFGTRQEAEVYNESHPSKSEIYWRQYAEESLKRGVGFYHGENEAKDAFPAIEIFGWGESEMDELEEELDPVFDDETKTLREKIHALADALKRMADRLDASAEK